jgi:hypothetical protein
MKRWSMSLLLSAAGASSPAILVLCFGRLLRRERQKARRPCEGPVRAPELQQLKEMVDQLAVSQQQMTDGIAKLAAEQQELLHKISAPPPRPAAAPARKPVPLPSSSEAR